MHLSEGVLHTPVLLGGAAVALVCVMIGLKRLNSQQLPLTALFAAAFFVAGTIHVPVGIGSVHLILNGMAACFSAGLFSLLFNRIGITSPAIFLRGFAVLGVNLCVMALPALLVHWLFAKRLENDNSRRTQITAGIGAGVIGVGGSALLASLVLALDGGKAYSDLIMLLVISHIPVFIVDSIVSVGVVLLLNKMYPTALSVVK